MLRFLYLLLLIASSSTAQSWQWARAASSYAEGKCVATDDGGNVYVAGNYTSSVNFEGTFYSCAGRMDLFVAKYDRNGNLQWVRTAGSPGDDAVYAIAANANGNVFITGASAGYNSQTLSFGSFVLNNSQAIMFLAEYDSNGNVVRASAYKGAIPLAISVAPSGEFFVAGTFATVATFDGYTLIPVGWHGIFIAKYTVGGSLAWVHGLGGKYDNLAYAVAADIKGAVYVAGVYSDTLKFPSETLYCTNARYNVFLAKYTSNGNFAWARSAEGTGWDLATSLSLDQQQNAVIAGYFNSDTLNFGPYKLINAGASDDICIAKYDSSGNVLWAKGAGGNANDYATSIATDSTGSIFLSGYSYSPYMILGTDSLPNPNCSAGSSNMFVAKLDQSGNTIWSQKTSDCGSNSNGIALSNDGLYLTGVFSSPAISFGSATLSNPSPSMPALWLAKMNLPYAGIKTMVMTPEIEIYPNPAHTIITLRYRSSGSHSLRVVLRNSLGDCVYLSWLKSFSGEYNQEVDIKTVQPGVYLLELSEGDKRVVRKVVIE